MTAKEKAKYLVRLFLPFGSAGPTDDDDAILKDSAKQCAIIAVDEISKLAPYLSKDNKETVDQFRASDEFFVDYWDEVKKEIEAIK